MLTSLCYIGAIVYRMCRLDRQASSFTKHLRGNAITRLKTINRIFVESALLYTFSVAINIIMEGLCNNAFYATTGVVSLTVCSASFVADRSTPLQSVEIAGIAFDLIIIRTWAGNPSTRPSAVYPDTESLRPVSPFRLPQFDFLGDDPFSKQPFGRTSFCPSEQGSVFTSTSRVRGSFIVGCGG